MIKFLIFDCSIIESYSGLMCLVNLFEKDISFIVIFGLRDFINNKKNNVKNGVLSACRILKEVKHIIGIKAILIGVSTGNLSNIKFLTEFELSNLKFSHLFSYTGLAFCGIIGHIVRRQFMVFGQCVDMATSLMMISYDKVRLMKFLQ